MRDVLAVVTSGDGKSLLPVIAASRLITAGVIDRIVWVVPRDSLKHQAEEAFADAAWRNTLSHSLSVRAVATEVDPSRGLAGYVTTYQAVAAAPDLHLAEFQRRRTLLVGVYSVDYPVMRSDYAATLVDIVRSTGLFSAVRIHASLTSFAVL